jgi:hypothetical protein
LQDFATVFLCAEPFEMNQEVDLFGEDRMTLQQLSRELDVHFSTAWRWALKGINGVRLPIHCVITTTTAINAVGRPLRIRLILR